ncbi:putative GPI-anchored cupredoxin [Ceratocystis lukuohia]|uniref:GPI-anchored cupredoxin n=1 Tax=Ceratocystis lukuohia TaxID=2019550 RepID=A0ABR4MDY6_9PEZI
MRFAVTALFAATVVMASSDSDDDDYYPQTRTVWIGGTNKVSPQELWANVGDKIEFHFLSGLHSVVEADFDDPCEHNGGFASGYFATSESAHQNVEVFVITIQDKSPLWYYDGAYDECMNGAVGVINPPDDDEDITIEGFELAAGVKESSSNPTESKGGYVKTY